MANSTSDSKSVKPRSSLLEMFDPLSLFSDSCPKHDATTEQVSPGQNKQSAELHTTNSDFNQSGLVSVPKSSQQDDTLSNESTDGIVVTQLSPELNVQPNVPIFDQLNVPFNQDTATNKHIVASEEALEEAMLSNQAPMNIESPTQRNDTELDTKTSPEIDNQLRNKSVEDVISSNQTSLHTDSSKVAQLNDTEQNTATVIEKNLDEDVFVLDDSLDAEIKDKIVIVAEYCVDAAINYHIDTARKLQSSNEVSLVNRSPKLNTTTSIIEHQSNNELSNVVALSVSPNQVLLENDSPKVSQFNNSKLNTASITDNQFDNKLAEEVAADSFELPVDQVTVTEEPILSNEASSRNESPRQNTTRDGSNVAMEPILSYQAQKLNTTATIIEDQSNNELSNVVAQSVSPNQVPLENDSPKVSQFNNSELNTAPITDYQFDNINKLARDVVAVLADSFEITVDDQVTVAEEPTLSNEASSDNESPKLNTTITIEDQTNNELSNDVAQAVSPNQVPLENDCPKISQLNNSELNTAPITDNQFDNKLAGDVAAVLDDSFDLTVDDEVTVAEPILSNGAPSGIENPKLNTTRDLNNGSSIMAKEPILSYQTPLDKASSKLNSTISPAIGDHLSNELSNVVAQPVDNRSPNKLTGVELNTTNSPIMDDKSSNVVVGTNAAVAQPTTELSEAKKDSHVEVPISSNPAALDYIESPTITRLSDTELNATNSPVTDNESGFNQSDLVTVIPAYSRFKNKLSDDDIVVDSQSERQPLDTTFKVEASTPQDVIEVEEPIKTCTEPDPEEVTTSQSNDNPFKQLSQPKKEEMQPSNDTTVIDLTDSPDVTIVAPSDVSEGNKKTGTKVVPEPIAKSIINGIEKCSPQRIRNVKDTEASAVREKGPLLDLNSPKVPATEVLRLASEFFGRYQEANKKSLATLESAFYDLLEKHETMYKNKVEELNKRISVEIEKNNAIREHASRVIDKANQDNLRLQEAQEANTAKQDAIIKLLNIKLAAAENSLQRKTLECQEWSSLCDQLTGKM